MKEKCKKLSKKIIFIIVFAAITGTILIACAGLQLAFVLADKAECWRPTYERVNLENILDKPILSDDDYGLLYRQTGLTKLGVDRALSRGTSGKNRILNIQECFFAEHKVINNFYCPYVCQDNIDEHVYCAYLEDGDILVTSSTHISGWRIGHAGLVIDAAADDVLEANAVGDKSKIGTSHDFTNRLNFIVLSPKADAAIKAEVVKYAENNLQGIVYDPTVGVFSSKNKIEKTQCAHCVWYAYNQFGIDLDSNGGLIVTPRDLANSPQVEVVQVFGFDVDKLWK